MLKQLKTSIASIHVKEYNVFDIKRIILKDQNVI